MGGQPVKCCQMSYTPPAMPDECRCGCGVLNGKSEILCGQFLLFVGFLLSAATIADCDFVTLEEPVKVREDGATATQLGFFSYKQTTEDSIIGNTDQCYYWYDEIPVINPLTRNERLYWNDQMKHYINKVLGPEWMPVLVVSCTALVLSFFVFLYVISYCCSAQVRGLRWFTGLFICIVIASLQVFGTWMIFYSDWCEDTGCIMGRGTIFSIVASCCFFLSGCFFLFTVDYPGTERLEAIKNGGDAQTEVLTLNKISSLGIEDHYDDFNNNNDGKYYDNNQSKTSIRTDSFDEDDDEDENKDDSTTL